MKNILATCLDEILKYKGLSLDDYFLQHTQQEFVEDLADKLTAYGVEAPVEEKFNAVIESSEINEIPLKKSPTIKNGLRFKLFEGHPCQNNNIYFISEIKDDVVNIKTVGDYGTTPYQMSRVIELFMQGTWVVI